MAKGKIVYKDFVGRLYVQVEEDVNDYVGDIFNGDEVLLEEAYDKTQYSAQEVGNHMTEVAKSINLSMTSGGRELL